MRVNSMYQSFYGVELMIVGRYDDAISQCRDALRTSPNNAVAHTCLSEAFHNKSMYNEALEQWKERFASKGDREAQEALDRGYAEAGYVGAMTFAAGTLAARSRKAYVSPMEMPKLYLLAGHEDQALDWLEKAYEARHPNTPYINAIPTFASLRDELRFQDLLRRMNLPM